MKPSLDLKALISLAIASLLLFSSSLALGQGIVTGSISAAVEDPQGAVVPGAKVQATQLETNRVFTTTSSNAGVVQIPSLPPGTYKIVVEARGFTTYTVPSAAVQVGTDTALGTIRLGIGNTSETVEVVGGAPAVVESTTDQLTATFESKEVASVPLGNTYDSFALFAPGVVTAGSGGFSNNNGAELSINGQRARSNNYQLDGQNNNDNTVGGANFFFGNQDAITELQVVTNFDAEYGRNLGGVVNYVTKGGTNSFHGTGYEFWQGDHFDSLQNQEKSVLFGFCPAGVRTPPTTGPFANCTKPVVPQYVQNQFGGTIGGPIKRDKLWFFGSANFQRNRSSGAPASSSAALTPTANGLATLESTYPNDPAVELLKQWAPVTITQGQPKFTSTTTIPVAANGFGPASNVEVGTLERFLSQPFNDYEATGRIDYQATSKDRIFGRYLFQKTILTDAEFTGAAGAAQGQFVNVPGRTQLVGIDYTHTFSPWLLNQARFGYSRSRSEFDGGGFSSCLLTSIGSCPPQITILDPTSLGVGQAVFFPQGRIINVYQVQDNASMVHGQHVMKWGGEYDKQRSPNYGLFGVNSEFLFQDFNSFIANTPLQTQAAYGQSVLRFKENDVALYFQDDWRAKDNLTLNLGLRWEFYQQASNLLHAESVQQQTGPNHLWDQNLPLSLTTVPKLPNHYRNFGPVVGFAWTPKILPGLLGGNKTVVRGGFRIAYDFAYYNLATNVQGNAPFTNFATIAGSNGNAAGIPAVSTFNGSSLAGALFPLAPKGNPGFATELQLGRNFRNPYSEQWNLGIQRRIATKLAAEIRYVGNHTIGNFQEVNGNPDVAALINNGFTRFVPPALRTPCTTPNTPGSTGTDQFGSPVGYANCNFSRLIEYANTGYSIYHGLQTQLRLQDWHGFTGEASYTFSKTIDNASEAFSTATGTFNALSQSPFDVAKAERAVSNYDYPHVVSLLWVYDLPFQKSQTGFVGHILGGWQINGTYRYNSGQPWTVEQSAGQGLCDPTNFTGSALDTCRPFLGNPRAPFTSVGECQNSGPGCNLVSLTSGKTIALSQAHFIINNVAAEQFFGTPFSPLGRNTERGQPISTVNLAVFKNFKIRERLTFQFQAEAFNALNHQWLGIPVQNVNNASASASGITQFGSLRFNGNGGDTFAGNIITDGIGRRRLQFGGKLIF